VYYNYY